MYLIGFLFVLIIIKKYFIYFRNETSLVSLRMLNSDGKKVLNAAFGMPYTLRAKISKSDGTFTFVNLDVIITFKALF